MSISRRHLLTATGTVIAATAINAGGLNGIARAVSQAANTALPTVFGVGQAGTTLTATVLPGTPNAKGYRTLVAGAGEAYTVRKDITGTAAVTDPTTMLAAFAHMSDLHIIDDQSPGRVEYLDGYAAPALPHKASYPTDSAYRPQEFLSTHLVDAMARSLKKVGFGPKSNLPLSFAVVTGDAVDNAQLNETRWYIDLLDGNKAITADSGVLGQEASVSSGIANGFPAQFTYWQPELSERAASILPMFATFGFQPYPGLLAAARKTYTSNGLGMPWFAVYGNHDNMVQGNLPVDTDPLGTDSINAITVGNSKIIDSLSPLDDVYDGAGLGFIADALLFLARNVDVPVAADPDRHLMTSKQFVNEHFTTTGLPAGHGFQANSSLAYYAVPDSQNSLVRYITLDSTNDDGGIEGISDNASGCIDDDQFLWLEQELIKNSTRYLNSNFQLVLQPAAQDKLFVIFAHHTLATMNNLAPNLPGFPGVPGSGDPVLLPLKHSGAELANMLWRFPNVVLVANGHTHRNEITPHARPNLSPQRTLLGAGGFWEVSAASHIDWPIQSRIIEMGVGGSTLSIFTNVVDVDAPLSSFGTLHPTPPQLASIARELAVNDPQEHYEDGTDTLVPVDMAKAGRRGADPKHRNAQLTLPMPFTIPAWLVRNAPQFFMNSTGVLFQTSGTGAFGIAETPATTTYPASAATGSSAWLVAFQRFDGLLWQVTSSGASGPVGGQNNQMSPGSSPAVAALPTGGMVVAFQRSNNTLQASTTDGFKSLGVSMQAGTSPAIAALPSGRNFVTAAHGSDGMLWISTLAGRTASTALPMKSGTSPAIASQPSGAYTAAFQGSDGTLWVVTHTGSARSLSLPMQAGTNPSITATTTGGYLIAIHHTDGTLWTIGSTGASPASTGLPMAAGTSPSLSEALDGSWVAFFQHSNGNFWKRDSTGAVRDTGIKMFAGTSPGPSVPFFGLPPKA